MLLYAGISPEQPKAGKAPSRETLPDRILSHLTRNAERSTLRLSLGCLLADRLGIRLGQDGKSKTFGPSGEAKLSEWMARNLAFAWSEHEEAWSVEQAIFARSAFPLNIKHNRGQPFAKILTSLRSEAKSAAKLHRPD